MPGISANCKIEFEDGYCGERKDGHKGEVKFRNLGKPKRGGEDVQEER